MPHVPSRTHTRSTHGARTRSTHDYDSAWADLSGGEMAAEQASVDAVVGVTNIVPGSINPAAFASSMTPVLLLSGTLPTLPDSLYPVGIFVYKTDDVPPRLYKNVADVWTAAIGPNDIQADSITAGQIAAGAISTTELAAGAVTIGKFADAAGSNFAPNPSFEVMDGATAGVSGVAIFGWGTQADTQYSTTFAKYGVNALRIGHTSAVSQKTLTSVDIPITPGRRVGMKVWIRGAAANNAAFAVRFGITEVTAAGGVSTTVSAPVVGASVAFAQYSFTTGLVLASTTVNIRIVLGTANAGAIGDVAYFDGVEVFYLDDDILHGSGNVTIDSTGITINNGKLTITDEYSTTVASGAGFAGGWADFIRSGLYGSDFAGGVVGTIALGRTAALPYWTYSRTGSPTVVLASDTTFPAGRTVRSNFSALTDRAVFLSDQIAVAGGSPYTIAYTTRETVVAGFVQTSFRVRWYDVAGALITSWTGGISGGSTTGRVALTTPYGSYAPANARYATLELTCFEFTTHDAGNRVELGGISFMPVASNVDPALNPLSAMQMTTGELTVSGGYYVPPGVGYGSLAIGPDGGYTLNDGASVLQMELDSGGFFSTYDANVGNSNAMSFAGTGTATFTNRTADWYVIGKMVFGRVRFTATANGSGAVAITLDTGMPAPTNGFAIIGDRGGVGVTRLVVRGTASGGTLNMTTFATMAAPTTALTGADVANGSTWSFFFFYLAA